MAGKRLFIEGAPPCESTGNLRQGFEKLFKKKLQGKSPRIVLSGDKNATIDKFLNNRFPETPFLLIDLDAAEEARNKDLEAHKLSNNTEAVFYMIQEMESWFLSQPEMLDEYYRPKPGANPVSQKCSSRPAAEKPDPKEELKRVTKNSLKGPYHNTKHAVDLLMMLDADKLTTDFPDFKKLVEKLA